MAKTWTVIKPKAYQKAQVRAALIGGLKGIAKEMVKDFEATTKTWSTPPEFTAEVKEERSRIVIDAGTDNEIYGYLDKGTQVRHALMSRDWISKTQPAIGGGAAVHLTSGKGAGHVVLISKKIIRPGIKARKFTSAIRGKWERELTRRMKSVESDMARASGHRK